MSKHVLITGGSGGIGQALVRAFSSRGYSVSFTYFHSARKALALAEETGANAFSVNFEDVHAVLDFAEKFVSECGAVDVLINNAGVSHYGLLQDVTLDDYHRLFNVNFQSHFFLTQKMISSMISKKSGAIINVASIWGETGASCEVLYSSSKGAMIAFTKALAKELALSGISVNCISPGVVETSMMRLFTKEEKEALAQDIPAGRFTEAREVAEIALRLAAFPSTSLTGQIIGINGGMYC